MAGLQNRYNTGPVSLMTTGLGGGISREELIRLQKEKEELDRQRRERILAEGPARSSGAVPTIEINRGHRMPDARSVDALKKSRLAQIEQNKINKYRNALADKRSSGQVPPAIRGGAPGMAKSERDPWLTDDDAAFLMSLLDPILNPPAPPTPYGTFGGGGNKAWASLPFLMRGHS